MKAGWRIVVVFLLLLGIVQAAVVDEKVVQELQNNPDVGVIVTLKDIADKTNDLSNEKSKNINGHKVGLGLSSLAQNDRENVLGKLKLKEKKVNKVKSKLGVGLSSDNYDLELKHKYSTINGFSGKVSAVGLQKLMAEGNVARIEYDYPVSILLDDSVPQIGANSAANISYNGVIVNGSGETVCVIDTGIDYTHPALGGCTNTSFLAGTCSKVLGGYDFGDNDNNPIDTNSHGTHVAGIIASMNGTYRGVAPGAKLVAVKVFSGSSSSTSYSTIIAGMEWCTNATNVALYNIYVISMSIGCDGVDCTHWQSSCDANISSGMATTVNAAVAKNISVMIAAGNSGWTDGISDPACLANATPVGAVSSSDVIKYNRGLLLSLLAPSDVTSSVPGGGFSYKTGTSMSTPHVSGAAVLLQQYNKMIHGRGLTPAEVRTTLNNTGKTISDAGGSGLNFSRINVYNALLSLDDVSPAISFISPDNGSISNLSVFINISSNEPLQNVLLEWNGTNESMSGSGTSFYKTKVSNISGDYSFRVYGWDLANNSNVTELRTVTIVDNKAPVLMILSPGNNTLQNYSFIVNISSDESLDRAVLEWNGTNETMLGSGTSYYLTKTNLRSGGYSFRIYGFDLVNNTNVTEIRFVNVNSSPSLVIVKPSTGQIFGSGFSLNATLSSQYNLSSCNYNISNSSGASVQYNNSAIVGMTFTWRDYVNVSNSTFNEGNYTLVVFGNDTVGNSVESNVTFNVDKTAPVIYGVNRSVDVVHNNDSVVIFVNVTDVHVNTSSVYLESNFSGSWNNYSMNFEGGERYNFTINSGNLSNQELILYRFGAADLVGNSNVSIYYNFTVQNRGLSSIVIGFPADGAVVEVGNFSAFNATAIDPDGDSLTYSWNFSDGNITMGKDVTHTFNVTGNFTIFLTISELLTSNTTNISVFVNDTTMPTVSSVTYDTEVHLQQDINQSVTAAFFDYSGISSATLMFNNSLKTANCSDTSTTIKACTWNWGNLSVGSYNFTINVTDNFTTAHINSSRYSFTVVSCSDGIKNGDETGTDCGGSCSACAPAPSPSPGDGGGPPKTTLGTTETTPIMPTPTPTPSPAQVVTTGAEKAPVPPATVPATTTEFTQTVTLDKEKETVIAVDKLSVAVKELKLSSKVGKEVQVSIKSLEQRPVEITEVPGTYQYLQIEVQLDQKEIDEALVSFAVPVSWLQENKYSADSVVLQRYADGVWSTLDTEVLTKSETEVMYQAELDHFSYFAIVGGVEKPREIPWLKLGIILGSVLLMLGLIYWWINRKGDVDDF